MADCLFCGIADKSIQSKIAYEDDEVLAFHDIQPQAPVHLLVIPKKHLAGVDVMETGDVPMVGALIYRAKEIAKQNGWKHYRLVVNNGAQAGQSVFHIHLHLLSGRPMRWPPG